MILKTWYKCVDHSQLRWLGPEKGAVHMAVAAIFNCLGFNCKKIKPLGDLHRKIQKKFLVG